ncbi:peptide ABC transporter ATP-binding protein [Oscillospiraceae bacterium]|nr:peptide ABC transporter ATP-binding protein [Oscillospiraceae bacterium]BDF73266.1 peptide ABC transporter ATP-binding protein [Oscillospiraceae bacterium]
MAEPLLKIRGLKKHFPVGGGRKAPVLKAVDGIDLDICPGETVGLVGESGCGKSTFGKAVINLHAPTGGSVIYKGQDISHYNTRQMRPLRRDLQFIFQDPYASLDPRQTIFSLVNAPLEAFSLGTKQERTEKVESILGFVGLDESQFHKLPHELSGGQRQRVVIARTMVMDPSFIVCDEPVSALDVSVRAQVLNLMKDAQKRSGVSYLFVSHDMSVVRYLCDKVAVMYLGRLVEFGTREDIFSSPLHPYTKALLSAVPIPDVGAKRERILLTGDVPSPLHPPAGCRFSNRCPLAKKDCSAISGDLFPVSGTHLVACPYAARPERPEPYTDIKEEDLT